MKNIFLTIMLVGLLSGAGLAQRGRSPMARGVPATQVGPTAQLPNHTRATAPLAQPNAVQMSPVAARPGAAAASKPDAVGTSNTSVGKGNHKVAAPDAAVGPDVSQRTLQR
jgi:hypothetical protein